MIECSLSVGMLVDSIELYPSWQLWFSVSVI
jgi:hypothetical protein